MSQALRMALATETAAEGPTPAAYHNAPYADRSGTLRGFATTPPSADDDHQIAVTAGLSTRMYGPSAGFVGMPGEGHWRSAEISITGPTALDGVDFSVAHRRGAEEDDSGRATTNGAELRIGRGLKGLTEFKSPPSWRRPAWYVFAASDGQALLYTPSSDPTSPNHAFYLQDRVNIGDLQIGVSAEANGMQASLSYIRREVTTIDAIRHEETADDNFTGLTLTWRR
ncbi:MAG TPA: hypothetical protein VG983_00605 [Caulobacterales bacterium]|nr:hypothetical protein [Caulobacterales bacterium]